LWIASDKLSKEFDHLRNDIIDAEAEKTEWTWYKKNLKAHLKKLWVVTQKQVKDYFLNTHQTTVARDQIDETSAQWRCEKLWI
jgi:hypothetical protein